MIKNDEKQIVKCDDCGAPATYCEQSMVCRFYYGEPGFDNGEELLLDKLSDLLVGINSGALHSLKQFDWRKCEIVPHIAASYCDDCPKISK